MAVISKYRDTATGIIPDEWGVSPLASVAFLERGKFSARPRNDPKYYGGDTPFIQTGDVAKARGDITTYSQTLNAEGVKVSRVFPRGTVFFTIAAIIGDVGVATFDTACPDSLVALSPLPGVDTRWLFYELQSRKRSFEALATQNAQLNINLEKLRPYLVPVPPAAEQRAIGAALADCDALLASIERLITKKRDLGDAVAIELLTGKRRLPGFRDAWKHACVRDVADVIKGRGLSKASVSTAGVHPCILYGELFTTYRRVIDHVVSATDSHDGTPSVAGDILVPGSTTTSGIDLAIASALLIDRVALGGDIIVMRQRVAAYDPVFVAHYISRILRDEIAERAQGITIIHLYARDVATLPLALPPLDEQRAISAVLMDVDAELGALVARREKTQTLKQGMMQELLTGRTRLL